MGLDLSHYKATLHPADPAEAFTFREDDFDAEAIDVLGFRRFIQIIPDSDYWTRIVIVKDGEALALLRAHQFGSIRNEGISILVGEPRDLVDRVEQIERTNGWDPAGRGISVITISTWRGTRLGYGHGRGTSELAGWSWDMPDAVREALQSRPPEDHPTYQVMYLGYAIPFRGLYAEEVGYQRKGMTNEFYQDFRGSPAIYVRRAEVLRAATFLTVYGDPEDDRRLRDNFQRNFLDNFEEGRSIFDVSY